MSGAPSEQGPFSAIFKEGLGTEKKLKKMYEENAAKKEAARLAMGQSNHSSGPASPSRPVERQPSQSSIHRRIPVPLGVQVQPQYQQPPTQATRVLPPLPWAGGPPQTAPHGQASPTYLRAGPPPLSPAARPPPGVYQYTPRQGFIAGYVAAASGRTGSSQPTSPAVATRENSQELRRASSAAPLFSQDQSSAQFHPSGLPQSRAGTNTPEIIPNKLAYQVQEEPDRLEVQPAHISAELPMPMSSSYSVPHTPATPSRLSMHKEVSDSHAVTLQVKNLGSREFIVPLAMPKRILKQYVDTIEYYPTSIKENMMQKHISEKSVDNLNLLLSRLANVSTHIGLEGGGPSSQDSVQSEQEALYAQLSSEKFGFLRYLFHHLRDEDLHIALVAQSGSLHDIVELFLKGNKVHYNRPSTYSKSNLGPDAGKLHVSVIASSAEGQPTHLTRNADLVIALDETFDEKNQTVVDLRRPSPNSSYLKPVLRLIVYSSVEHIDLCLSRTLEPVDRLRKLIFCVWHTQSIVGELEDSQPSTQDSAERVAVFLRRGGQSEVWALPHIRPIPIPAMDSDSSSLSDAMSDVSATVGRPRVVLQECWPQKAPATVGIASTQVLSGGKRPFDLEHGDSVETQLKKQKMAKRAHAGKPIEEPHTIEDLEKLVKDMQITEHRLIADKARQEETIASFRNGAERRQGAFEELRDKWSDLHHDKIELTNEVAKLRKELEKARSDRLALQGERGQLKQDLEAVRQQLINHPNPLIAQESQKDAQVRDLQTANAGLQKKFDFTNTQLNYLQEQYREVSVNAANYREEIEELQKKIEPLEGRLQHEYARRKHERENDPRRPLYKEIDNLRTEMKTQAQSAERVIMKKEEEIRELKRGRAGGVQTRGSSVAPRSPRGGSRGVSPAAGLLPGAPAGGGNKGSSGLNRSFNMEE